MHITTVPLFTFADDMMVYAIDSSFHMGAIHIQGQLDAYVD